MFVAYYYNGGSTVPLAQSKNNEIKLKKKTTSQVNPMKNYTLI